MKISSFLPIFLGIEGQKPKCSLDSYFDEFGSTESGDGWICKQKGKKIRCKFLCGEGRVKLFNQYFATAKCKKNGEVKIHKYEISPPRDEADMTPFCIDNKCDRKAESKMIPGGFLKTKKVVDQAVVYDVKCSDGKRHKKAASCDPSTGVFEDPDSFRNLCLSNDGAFPALSRYRCDFVPGQVHVNGTIHLQETMIDGLRGVHINGSIFSSDPAFVDGEHGFHVHSSSDPSDKCAATGGHFASNPDQIHGPPTAALPDRHAGDLGNIFVDAGAATIDIFDQILSLDEESPVFIGDRGIVLHAAPDDGNPDRDPASTGAAGARLACCAITKDDD